MTSIDIILNNPLVRESHARRKLALKVRFPELASCSDGLFLSLGKYLDGMPHQFYSELVYCEYMQWLEKRDHTARGQLQAYLSEREAEIDRALLHLEEINGLGWHDSFQKLDDYEVIRFVDQQVHPTYLRLVEAVFCPLLRVVAHFSRIDREKGTDGLDVWSVVEELQGSCLEDALGPYHHIIRNGIGHGGVTFLEKAIRYRDKKGNEEKFGDSEIVRICDDLIDTCNALALAFSVFVLTRKPYGYRLPRQLLIEELSAETKSPWWEIVGCTPSQFAGVNQLIVYARPNTADLRKVQMATLQSGILAEQFAPGFDRYFFSIRAENSWPGWSAFDGKKLRELRERQNVYLEDYRDVIKDGLPFYVTRFRLPAPLGRLETLVIAFRIHLPQYVVEFRRKLGVPDISVRNAGIHRNSWGCVLNGSVFLRAADGEVDQDGIRKSCRAIIRRALSCARQQLSIADSTRHLPLGYARIAVFRKNYRKRRLSSFGLGEDLVCTVQFQRLSRIRSPDIMGSTIEYHGSYRIAWNRAWLDNLERRQCFPADSEDDPSVC